MLNNYVLVKRLLISGENISYGDKSLSSQSLEKVVQRPIKASTVQCLDTIQDMQLQSALEQCQCWVHFVVGFNQSM